MFVIYIIGLFVFLFSGGILFRRDLKSAYGRGDAITAIILASIFWPVVFIAGFLFVVFYGPIWLGMHWDTVGPFLKSIKFPRPRNPFSRKPKVIS